MGMQHFGKRLARQPIVDKPPYSLVAQINRYELVREWFGSLWK